MKKSVLASFALSAVLAQAPARAENKSRESTVCSREAFGSFIGVDGANIAFQLMTDGKMVPITDDDPPCKPKADPSCTIFNCSGRLQTPIPAVAISTVRLSRFSLDTVVAVACGPTYDLFPHDGSLVDSTFFVSEVDDQHWAKFDVPGRVDDLSSSEWRELENELDAKIKHGFIRGPEDEERPGVPLKMTYRGVRILPIAPGIKARGVMITKTEKNYDEPVYGFWIIGTDLKRRSRLSIESQHQKELLSVSAIVGLKDEKHFIVGIRGPTNNFLYSIDKNGQIVDQVKRDHFLDECD